MLNSQIPDNSWEGLQADNLLSPYMRDLMGNVRVLDAKMECVRKPDGLYHYVYTLKAEIRKDDEGSTCQTLTTTSNSITLEAPAPPAPKKEVTLVIYDHKQSRGQKMTQFEETTTLKEVLRHFYCEMKDQIQGARMTLLLDADPNKSMPLKQSLIEKKLAELMLLPPNNTYSKLTIVADSSNAYRK